MNKQQQTSKKDYALFRREVKRWAKELSLTDWDLYFHHKDVKDGLAGVTWDVEARQAIFLFSVDWSDHGIETTVDEEIKRTAQHETIHLMLGRMVSMAKDRFVTDKEIEEEAHRLIMTLQSALSI